MTEREPNILDQIASYIPGYTSFQDKETRRDSDKVLRDHVAERLDGCKRHLDDLVLQLTDAGELAGLADVDRLKRRIGTCADSIRHAEYGESGLMDEHQVGEAELDRVHAHDLALLDHAKRVAREVSELTAENFGETSGTVTTTINDLLQAIEQRGSLLKETL